MISAVSPPLASPVSGAAIESRAPVMKSQDEMRAEWRAAHNANLTAQQAFQSGAELGPINTTNSQASNYASKLHTEIKIDGKVVARVYNSGAMEIPNEYSFLLDEMGTPSTSTPGPDLAEDRAQRIKDALARHGAVVKDDLSPAGLLTAQLVKTPVIELLRAQTAQTQAQWQGDASKRGPLDPGTFFAGSA